MRFGAILHQVHRALIVDGGNHFRWYAQLRSFLFDPVRQRFERRDDYFCATRVNPSGDGPHFRCGKPRDSGLPLE
ncbi:MAG: hypothetical protein HRU82_11855 [Nitrospira sp.]|nr:MAG: hypothetical protein HRU82_11855 [Nitrospira sp.]